MALPTKYDCCFSKLLQIKVVSASDNALPVIMLRVKMIYRATSGGDGHQPNSIMEAEGREE